MDWRLQEENSDKASSTMQPTGVQKMEIPVDDAVTEEMFPVDYWEWSVSDAIVPTSPYPSPQQESGNSCDHATSSHSLDDVPRPGQPATPPPIQVGITANASAHN